MERKITNMLARISLTYLRIGMGILFLWFGVLKFFPGINSAGLTAGCDCSRTIDSHLATLSGELAWSSVQRSACTHRWFPSVLTRTQP